MRKITVGFTMTLICFPFHERENWRLGYYGHSWCFGTFRFSISRVVAYRN